MTLFGWYNDKNEDRLSGWGWLVFPSTTVKCWQKRPAYESLKHNRGSTVGLYTTGSLYAHQSRKENDFTSAVASLFAQKRSHSMTKKSRTIAESTLGRLFLFSCRSFKKNVVVLPMHWRILRNHDRESSSTQRISKFAGDGRILLVSKSLCPGANLLFFIK